MAPGPSKSGKRAPSASGAKRPAATSGANAATPDATTEGDADEPAPPMNRAQRRLEAKQKSGRNAPTRVTPNGMSSARDSMQKRAVQGGQASAKGTNTRRSG
jgi:hypothetical protein